MKENGYETRQSSLLYVFVRFFGLDVTSFPGSLKMRDPGNEVGLDGAQNTIVVYSVLRK